MMKTVGDPLPWQFRYSLTAVADVDQTRDVGVVRFRRTTGDDNEREDKPEQGLHTV